ncbi:5-formyltetrahydrofolate cyclo-ligase [Marinicella meishanensis]|uniref:5-formyltetrahydrofolate cyclo-ligase n=1 Tax=Marinicella meishanensis TaxID=2873263 RepID=UPI001CBD79D7|nr:5-formyltetrahydrofolate cyclo-ligase [Marinicella sp. NBU2979]
MNKQDIRAPLRQQRARLSTAQIQSNSAQVVQHIIESSLWQQALKVAIYWPCQGEIDLTALLTGSDKAIYLPAIQGQNMQFQRHHENLILHPHRYGMRQPAFIEGLTPAPLDLCLMPLLGFDEQGNRLGLGGGFYDRYFADQPPTTLAGVAHAFQQVAQLPTDAWDVKLQHIFTEQGHHEF